VCVTIRYRPQTENISYAPSSCVCRISGLSVSDCLDVHSSGHEYPCSLNTLVHHLVRISYGHGAHNSRPSSRAVQDTQSNETTLLALKWRQKLQGVGQEVRGRLWLPFLHLYLWSGQDTAQRQ